MIVECSIPIAFTSSAFFDKRRSIKVTKANKPGFDIDFWIIDDRFTRTFRLINRVKLTETIFTTYCFGHHSLIVSLNQWKLPYFASSNDQTKSCKHLHLISVYWIKIKLKDRRCEFEAIRYLVLSINSHPTLCLQFSSCGALPWRVFQTTEHVNAVFFFFEKLLWKQFY